MCSLVIINVGVRCRSGFSSVVSFIFKIFQV